MIRILFSMIDSFLSKSTSYLILRLVIVPLIVYLIVGGIINYIFIFIYNDKGFKNTIFYIIKYIYNDKALKDSFKFSFSNKNIVGNYVAGFIAGSVAAFSMLGTGMGKKPSSGYDRLFDSLRDYIYDEKVSDTVILEKALLNYQNIKKISYVFLSGMSIIFVTIYLAYFIEPKLLAEFLTFPNIQALIGYISFLIFVQLLLIILFMYRDFRDIKFMLYYTKACAKCILKNNESSNSIHILRLGLFSYNRFLLRKINLQIEDIEKIISKISCINHDARLWWLHQFSESFLVKDELGPLADLSNFLDDNIQTLLVKKSFRETIADYSGLIIPIASTIISITGLIYTLTR